MLQFAPARFVKRWTGLIVPQPPSHLPQQVGGAEELLAATSLTLSLRCCVPFVLGCLGLLYRPHYATEPPPKDLTRVRRRVAQEFAKGNKQARANMCTTLGRSYTPAFPSPSGASHASQPPLPPAPIISPPHSEAYQQFATLFKNIPSISTFGRPV